MKKKSEIQIHPSFGVTVPLALFFFLSYSWSLSLGYAIYITVIIGIPCLLGAAIVLLPDITARVRGVKNYKRRLAENRYSLPVMIVVNWVLNLKEALTAPGIDHTRINLTGPDSDKELAAPKTISW